MIGRFLAAALSLLIALPVVAQIALPWPGPGLTNVPPIPIGTPASLGTRTISGVTATCNITTTANIVAADLVVVAVQIISGSPVNITVSSVSDGTNTYTRATGIQDAGTVYDNEIWYKENASAVSSGATITIQFTATTNNNGCAAQSARVANIKTASSLDKVATQQTTTATPSVTTATLAQNSEIAFGVTYQNTGTPTYTEASGFTNMVNAGAVGNGNGRVSFSYQIVSTTAAVTYAPTWSASNPTLTALATFKGL